MDDPKNLNLFKAIARSEGYNSSSAYNNSGNTGGTKKRGYLPIYHHPLPISENRYDHEVNLRMVLSCKVAYQGIAAISKSDAWVLEEVYMRNDKACLGDKFGASPLHVAVQKNDIDCILVLINIGVNMNAINDIGDTPLFLAHALGHTHLERLLKENNAMMYNESNDIIPYSGTVLDADPERRVPVLERQARHRQPTDIVSNQIRACNH
jgi:ankyrin repeat protein